MGETALRVSLNVASPPHSISCDITASVPAPPLFLFLPSRFLLSPLLPFPCLSFFVQDLLSSMQATWQNVDGSGSVVCKVCARRQNNCSDAFNNMQRWWKQESFRDSPLPTVHRGLIVWIDILSIEMMNDLDNKDTVIVSKRLQLRCTGYQIFWMMPWVLKLAKNPIGTFVLSR